jgi:hypothetical protein
VILFFGLEKFLDLVGFCKKIILLGAVKTILEFYECQNESSSMQDSNSPILFATPAALQIFEWCSTDLISEFFEVLAQNGGTYTMNRVDLQMVELIFPLNGKTLANALCPLFESGCIPVDCSLFVQAVFQMNLSLIQSKLVHRKVGFIRAENDELHTILEKTACNDKAQWLLSVANDQYIGMTISGPQTKSELEWKTHIATAIHRYQSVAIPFRTNAHGESVQRPGDVQKQMDQCRIGIWMAHNQLNRIGPEMFVLDAMTRPVSRSLVKSVTFQAESRASRTADHSWKDNMRQEILCGTDIDRSQLIAPSCYIDQSSTGRGFGMSYPSAMRWTDDVDIFEIREQPLTAKEIIEKEQRTQKLLEKKARRDKRKALRRR